MVSTSDIILLLKIAKINYLEDVTKKQLDVKNLHVNLGN